MSYKVITFLNLSSNVVLTTKNIIYTYTRLSNKSGIRGILSLFNQEHKSIPPHLDSDDFIAIIVR